MPETSRKIFVNLDGHHWEVFWMDPKGLQQ
jgi:predicted lactoylglutathione lyase